MAKLGSWRLDDGVTADASADDLLLASLATIGGSADVAQVRDLPASVAQAFGLYVGDTITRPEAMRVPTIRRARQVVCGTIGAQPLIAHRTNPDGSITDVTAERRLLLQPDPNTTLQNVLTWTVDDLFFHGISWWHVMDRDADGFPRAIERLAPELGRLTVDVDNRVAYVDGKLAENRDLIRFDGPDEGLLKYAGSTLATSRLLDAAVRRLASGDIPLGALKLAEGAKELSTEPGSAFPGNPDDDRSQVEFLLDQWEDARRTRTWAFVNRAIDVQTFQKDARESQLAEGRQQQRIDEANICNVPPRVVNAPSSDSMTYSTVAAERADLADLSMLGFTVAIEQRLSLGDVTPRGTAVRFDLTRFLSGDTLSALEAAGQAVALEAMTSDEVRTDVLGRPPLTDAQRAQLPSRKTPPPSTGVPA